MYFVYICACIYTALCLALITSVQSGAAWECPSAADALHTTNPTSQHTVTDKDLTAPRSAKTSIRGSMYNGFCFVMRCSLFMLSLLCRDALSSGLPGLTFVGYGYGNSASVTVGYGVAASDPLLPCRTATTLVPPLCSHCMYHIESAASITCPSCHEVYFCLQIH